MDKKCHRCGVTKSLSENFCKHGFDPYGKQRYAAVCKECQKLDLERKSKRKAYIKKWRTENTDKVAAANKRKYLRKKGVYVPVPEPKPSVAKGIEHYKEYMKRNREYFIKKAKECRIRNREAYRKRKKNWLNNNPGKISQYNHNRRAAKIRAGGTFTNAEIKVLLHQQEFKCAVCNGNLSVLPKHLDHKIPLCKGGRNDIFNLQWLCAPCNLSKGSKLVAA